MATALNPVPAGPLSRLQALEIKALWKRTFKQSPAFLLTGFFVFLEYVRPAASYPILDILPWGQLSLLGATLACLLEGKNAIAKNPVGWGLIGLFTLVIAASSFAAVDPKVSFNGWELWISWLLVMFIITSATDNEERFLLMLVGFLLWNFKMSQHAARSWALSGFAFRSWGVAGAPGWFTNSGEFAIEMCVFLPMVIYFLVGLRPHLTRSRQLFLAGVAVTAVMGIVASSSRGGQLGAAAVGLFIILLSPRRLSALSWVSVLGVIMWFLLPEEQKARFSTAGDDGTSTKRITYWTHAIKIANEYPVLGIGYDNWLPYYLKNYDPEGALPHNIFLEAWAELGYIGLFVFLLLIGYTFWQNWHTRRLTKEKGRNPNRFLYYSTFGLDGALIGYMVSGFFVTVLYYPYFWVNLAFTIALANVARSPARDGGRRRVMWRAGVPVRGPAPATAQGRFARERTAPPAPHQMPAPGEA